MIYYTADLHLGHEASIGKSSRPFLTVDDMDRILIDNWNRVVTPEDTIYILGDLISKPSHRPEHYLGQLKGKKHLILGNHDVTWTKSCRLEDYFETVDTIAETTDGGKRVILCHFPMVEWWGSQRGSILLYGHVHNRRLNPTYSVLRQLRRAYNCGVDIQDFKPVTLEQVIAGHRRFYGV